MSFSTNFAVPAFISAATFSKCLILLAEKNWSAESSKGMRFSLATLVKNTLIAADMLKPIAEQACSASRFISSSTRKLICAIKSLLSYCDFILPRQIAKKQAFCYYSLYIVYYFILFVDFVAICVVVWDLW